MFKIILISCTILLSALVEQTTLVRVTTNQIDLFKVSKISGFRLQESAEFDRLNEILTSQTDSDHPGTNLDIILDELILDYKNKVPFNRNSVEAKRLILSLRTLDGENGCNYHAYNVHSNCQLACIQSTWNIEDDRLRRIDGIVNYYLERRIKNCKHVYFAKFDEISKNLDKNLVNYLDNLLSQVIDSAKADQNERGKAICEAQSLYNLATNKAHRVFMFTSEYIYNVLKDSARDDPDKEFVQPVADKQSGLMSVRSDKLYRLYNDYIVNPCNHFRELLGPNVFIPIMFDGKFAKHQVQSDRVDFYEAWLKYELCFGSFKRDFSRVLDYATKQTNN